METNNIVEALRITGFTLCEFKADGDETCDSCEETIKKGNNVYYERTCYESDEGNYHCESCLISKPSEWKEQAEYYDSIHGQ